MSHRNAAVHLREHGSRSCFSDACVSFKRSTPPPPPFWTALKQNQSQSSSLNVVAESALTALILGWGPRQELQVLHNLNGKHGQAPYEVKQLCQRGLCLLK